MRYANPLGILVGTAAGKSPSTRMLTRNLRRITVTCNSRRVTHQLLTEARE
jgi:hypothetical protein